MTSSQKRTRPLRAAPPPLPSRPVPIQVLGVDPSITSLGLALITSTSVAASAIPSAGKRTDTLAMRDARITALVEGVRPWVPTGALVVIEGPAFGAPGGSTWDRAGLWHRLVNMFTSMDCQVAVAAPGTRAKWATGNGKADKAAVAVAISRLFPEVELENSDSADALVFAAIGAQVLGMRPQTKTRAESAQKVDWPTLNLAGLAAQLTLDVPTTIGLAAA